LRCFGVERQRAFEFLLSGQKGAARRHRSGLAPAVSAVSVERSGRGLDWGRGGSSTTRCVATACTAVRLGAAALDCVAPSPCSASAADCEQIETEVGDDHRAPPVSGAGTRGGRRLRWASPSDQAARAGQLSGRPGAAGPAAQEQAGRPFAVSGYTGRRAFSSPPLFLKAFLIPIYFLATPIATICERVCAMHTYTLRGGL
jgi:hypothetical protein